jgi:hypothetical protein
MIDPKEDIVLNNIIESENINENREPSIDMSPTEIPKEIMLNEPPIQMPSWSSWFFWIFVLIGFIIFYFSAKYESNYIKSNASSFELRLDEIKEDVKDFLRTWIEWIKSLNDSLYDKSSQFFFRQHVVKDTFLSKP